MALDYGAKRTGIAVTDDLKIIASSLDTVPTPSLMAYLQSYFSLNNVEQVVIGLPTDLRGAMSDIEEEIGNFIARFAAAFPQIEVERMDERFTSKMASQAISQSGKSRKQRKDKGMIDRVSATLILQDYLDKIQK